MNFKRIKIESWRTFLQNTKANLKKNQNLFCGTIQQRKGVSKMELIILWYITEIKISQRVPINP